VIHVSRWCFYDPWGVTHAGEDEVVKDRVVDSFESTRARALLLLAGRASWLANHTALSDEDNVAVRELLLELTGEPTIIHTTEVSPFAFTVSTEIFSEFRTWPGPCGKP
jgi:hypothetical protein